METPSASLWSKAMRVIVKAKNGPNLRLILPTGLILNRFAAGWVCKSMEINGMHLSKEQAVTFLQELKRYRRKHRDWVLVEAESANGDYVKVKL